MTKKLVLCFSFLLITSIMIADNFIKKPDVMIPYTSKKIKIDGKLNDAVWKDAIELSAFNLLGEENKKTKCSTSTFLLHDKNNIFLGMRCLIPKGKQMNARKRPRDHYATWRDESVEIFIGGLSISAYKHFIINIFGCIYDAAYDRLKPENNLKWTSAIKVKCKVDGNSWTLEACLPKKELNIDGDIFVLNLARNCHSGTREHSSWSPTGNGFHNPSNFGVAGLLAPNVKARDIQPVSVKLHSNQFQLQMPDNDSLHLKGISGCLAFVNKIDVKTSPSHQTVNINLPKEYAASVIVGVYSHNKLVSVFRYFCKILKNINMSAGYSLGDPALGLWWCDSMIKVMREQPLPVKQSKSIKIQVAGNESEAVQLVLHPPKDITATIQVSDFQSKNNTLKADHIEILEVDYVKVLEATDSFGWVGDWPDPLVPVERKLVCKAGQNQPIWLRFNIPANTPGGNYTGKVKIIADGKIKTVPVELKVFDFSLPNETTTPTLYGNSRISYGWFGVSNAKEMLQVDKWYLDIFRKCRVSPYDLRWDMSGNSMKKPPFTIRKTPHATIKNGNNDLTIAENWTGEMVQFNKDLTIKPAFYYSAGDKINKMKPAGNTHVVAWEIKSQDKSKVVIDVTTANRGRRVKHLILAYWQVTITANDVTIELRKIKNTSNRKQTITGASFEAVKGKIAKADIVPLINSWSIPALNSKQAHIFKKPPVWKIALKQKSQDNLSVQTVNDWKFDFDFTEFDKCGKRYFDKYKFNAMRFRNMEFPGSNEGLDFFTPQLKRMHKAFSRPIVEHAKKMGWADKLIMYWTDEPKPRDFEYARKGYEILSASAPELKSLLTVQQMPIKQLEGPFKIWCPNVVAYNNKVAKNLTKRGFEVWWYVCSGQWAPYPNDFIDHPGIAHRVRYWLMQKYDIKGDLAWSGPEWKTT